MRGRETPTIGASALVNNCYTGHNFTTSGVVWVDNSTAAAEPDPRAMTQRAVGQIFTHTQDKQEVIVADRVAKRVVQVYIVDPNEHVPVSSSLIYQDEKPYMTDLTDQELFFEIDLKAKLEAHNIKRMTFVNKTVKDRTEYLEPAKIRDLKMTVVEIAKF